MRDNILKYFLILVSIIVISSCAMPGGGGGSTGSWPQRLGGLNDDTGNALAVDSSGNVFVAGTVVDDADLNGNGSIAAGLPETPQAGVHGSYDVFLSKFNSSGTFLWAKRLGGSFLDEGYGVAVDGSGNVIVTGYVLDAADLDGGGSISGGLPETPALVNGSNDIFIAKFSSAGSFQWARRMGGTGVDYGYAVAADSAGNVFVTGVINGNADLNGDGSISGGLPETAPGATGDDVFIVKFDSTGIYQWAYRLWSTGSDKGYAVAAVSGGNVAVVGVINGNAYLDGAGSSQTTAYGNGDAFISVFSNDATGTFQWSKLMGGSGNTDEAHGVFIAGSGNISITGFVNGSADLNGNGTTTDNTQESSSYGSEDIFISVFSATGTAMWVQRLGGSGNDRGLAITGDSSDNLIITGFVSGSADLDGDGSITAGVLPETPAGIHGLEDIFSAKFSSGGNFLWSTRLGGLNNDEGRGVGTDSGGKIYLTGSVQGSADLNDDAVLDAGLPETASGIYGSYDIFVSQLAGQ